MLSPFSVDSRNCGPGERAKQGQFVLHQYPAAALTLS